MRKFFLILYLHAVPLEIFKKLRFKALPFMIELYDFLFKAWSSPISRYFIKKEVGSKKFKQMESHLIPMLQIHLSGLKNGTEDTITRNSPAMILFHADKIEIEICSKIFIVFDKPSKTNGEIEIVQHHFFVSDSFA